MSDKLKISNEVIHKPLTYSIALIWIANGLFCKLLNLVPRHEQIVSRILGNEHAVLFTKLIGIAEIGMAIWILTGIWPRLNAVIQIVIIATMNTLEFFLAPDLLLWGRMNSVYALGFIIVIWYNEFVLNQKIAQEI